MKKVPKSSLAFAGSFAWHDEQVRSCIQLALESNRKSNLFENEGNTPAAQLYSTRATQMMMQANVHALMMQYAPKEETHEE